jgi:hypothetical protein
VKPNPLIELPLALSRLSILPFGALRLKTLSLCCAVDFAETLKVTTTLVINAPVGIPAIVILVLSGRSGARQMWLLHLFH